MYKIIGADGKEYGPISADQLKQWIAEGRANQHTKVLAEGATEWKPLGEIPELAAALPVSPAPAPPTPTSIQPGGVASPSPQISAPAIFLLVLAILDILSSLVGIGFIALGQTLPIFAHMPPESVALQQKFSILFSLPACVLGVVIAIVRLIGAFKMMKLQSYGFAMATAILTLIPCTNTCCCLLNIGAGIWALVVLAKPEVKAAFQ
jgi:uncharacterized membrane protein